MPNKKEINDETKKEPLIISRTDSNNSNNIVLQAPEGFKLFYDKDNVPYTNENIIQGIINHSSGGGGWSGFIGAGSGALGPGYAGGPWSDCVKKMAAWYQANIHSYGKIYTPCPLIGNKPARHDCTGFVRACLQLFGCDLIEVASKDMTPGSTFDKVLRANGFSLVQNSPYVISQTAKPWDICSRTVYAGFGHGHAEIFAGEFGGRFKSWGWGSVHDTAHGGMPSGITRTEKYEFIWRKT